MHDGICIREITSEEGNRLLRIVRRARSTVSDARAVMNPGSTGRGSRLLIHDQRGSVAYANCGQLKNANVDRKWITVAYVGARPRTLIARSR